MSKKIELRVQAQGEKCNPVILKTVAKLQGVKSMSLDYDEGVLTITGCVDVVEVVKQLRKAKRPAVVISVGPENPPVNPEDDNKDDGKEDPDECPCNNPLPCYCYYPQPSNCTPQLVAGCPQIVFYDQPPYNNCTIC